MIDLPFKWVGSKRRLLETILPLIPEYQDYYEPFLGGGAVFFSLIQQQKTPKKCILSDINADLINLWTNIQKNAKQLVNELTSLKDVYKNTKEQYWVYREIFNEYKTQDVYKAALFLFLIKTGFNGLVSYNSKGAFNAAWGNRDFQFNDLESVAEVLNKHDITFSVGSYENINPQCGDFIFLDPPYLPIDKRAIDNLAYSTEGFDSKAHQKLAAWCANKTAIGCKLLMCNNLVPEVSTLYPSPMFKIHEISLMKVFSGKGSSRQKTGEVLVAG